MLDGHSADTHLKPLSKIEITALIVFSAVMFYLLLNIFLIAAQDTSLSSKAIPVQQSTENEPLITITNEKQNEVQAESTEQISTESSTDPTVIQINSEQELELTKQQNQHSQKLAKEVVELCEKVSDKLGSVDIDECLSAELLHSGSHSTLKKPLAYRDFIFDSEDDDLNNKTRVMLIGGIHGDEYSGVSISFKWLHNLAKAYSQETGVDVKNLHWRVIPLLNPDGLLKTDGDAHRMNANFVDLNRNFPTPDWDELAIKFWKEKRYSDKRRYPGPASSSETETQWMVNQVEEFDPHAVISIHAPYGILDADGPIEPPPNVGPLQLKILGTYPGSMGRYVGVYKNISMLTVELKHAGIMPSKKDIDHIWLDIMNWINEKVVNREASSNENDSALQSMRHEINGTTKEILIDKKAGD